MSPDPNRISIDGSAGHRAVDDAAGALLLIDLDAVVRNYRLIAKRVAPARTAAVVKADAYGLGARAVVRVLAADGCRDFFVAHLSEAIAISDDVPADARVFILNGLQPGAETLCAERGFVAVLNAFDQAARYATVAGASGRRLPVAVQVDSGMSRLGMSADDVAALAADTDLLARLDIVLVMSHLACADVPDAPANMEQRLAFARSADLLPPAPRSLSNSGGCFLAPEFHHDLVRPGIALYGGAPHEGDDNPMQPVIHLQARIIQVRTVPAGTGVGYGLSFTAPTPRRIATIAVGYADGWPRSLGNRGHAYIDGIRVPIAGRVSMDSITLDVSDVPEDRLKPGALVELLGDHQRLDDVAADAGTISYEILTHLGDRYARRYVGGDGAAVRSIAG